jgi:ABC-type transport system involved in multi-copper enzyme maturation permease subunit
MNRIAALSALTRYTVGRLLQPGRLLITVGIFIFPLAVAMLHVMKGRREINLLAGTVLVYQNLYWVLMASTMYNALAVTSRELEDGSALYLYSGILPRWAIYLARYFTVVVFLTAVASLSVIGLWIFLQPMGLSLGVREVAMYCAVSALGIGTYSALYMACGAWFKHSMAAALVLTVLWEVVLFLAPTQLWPYTITSSLRGVIIAEIYDNKPPGWLFAFVREYKKLGIEILTTSEACLFLGILISGLLLVGAWAMSRRHLTDRPASE